LTEETVGRQHYAVPPDPPTTIEGFPLARNLVVVESPAKAKTIGKYLGKDYDVPRP